MRVLMPLACVLALSGCRQESPPTGPKPPADHIREPQDTKPADKPEPVKVEDGPPWSEGAANKKLLGLTDDELEKLLGKPTRIDADPNGSADRLWHYKDKKWIKGEPGDSRTFGVHLTLRKGKVVAVRPIG